MENTLSVNDGACFHTLCVCVQMLWRQVHEAHDLCMSVWTVSVLNPSRVGGCALCEGCYWFSTQLQVSFHLVERSVNWLATDLSLRHLIIICRSISSFWSKSTLFAFISPGYHSKEIPRHHCKSFKFTFHWPTHFFNIRRYVLLLLICVCVF